MHYKTIPCNINMVWGSNLGPHAYKVNTFITHFIMLDVLILVPNEVSFAVSVYLLGAFKR